MGNDPLFPSQRREMSTPTAGHGSASAPATQPGSCPENDFRYPAVQASLQLLKEIQDTLPPGEDPLQSGLSLCLPADAERQQWMKRMGLYLRLLFGGAVAMIFLSPIWVVSMSNALLIDNLPAAAAFVLCFGMGLVVLFVGSNLVMFHSLKQLRKRLRSQYGSGVKLINVSIENPSTFRSKVKFLGDDIAVMALIPHIRCVHIEGCLFRYMLHCDDIIDINSMPAKYLEREIPAATSICCMIAETRLGLIISRNDLFQQLLMQFEYGETAVTTQLTDHLRRPQPAP